jgi:DNA-binding NarL/FixJ family response regulator
MTLRVFLVDDAAPVRRRIALLLADIAGVTIVGEAEDVESALAALLRDPVDVALVDLQLAAGHGLDVIAALRAARPRIVVIVLTNHSAPAFETACRLAGAHHFFDKTDDYLNVRRTVAALAALAAAGGPAGPGHGCAC